MTELLKCGHGLPRGFCRECAQNIANMMARHAVDHGIPVKDVRVSTVLPEDLFGMPSGEPGMVFCDNEVEAVKHLTQEEMTPSNTLLFGTPVKLTDANFLNMLNDAQDRRYPHYEIPAKLLDALQVALNQIPNTKLDNADYPDTYTLVSRLEYIVGKAKHTYWQRCRRDAGFDNNEE